MQNKTSCFIKNSLFFASVRSVLALLFLQPFVDSFWVCVMKLQKEKENLKSEAASDGQC